MSAGINSNSAQKDDPIFAEDVTQWISSIKAFVRETKAKSLDLSRKGIGLKEIKSILELLSDSEVTELNLEGNDWSNNIKSLFESLKRTKIKKLDLEDHSLNIGDLLFLLDGINNCEIADVGPIPYYIHEPHGGQIVSHLLQSQLSTLHINFYCKSANSYMLLLANGLPRTSFTSLRIYGGGYAFEDRFFDGCASILSRLPFCQIRDLDLTDNTIDTELMEELSRNLEKSKLEKLRLRRCYINDSDLDILAQGLVKSNISELDLSDNMIHGSNNFKRYLKKTNIKVLNLSSNYILKYDQMFRFPCFLKGSLVESLDVSSCGFTDEVGGKLIRSIKSTQIKKLNLSFNELNTQSVSALAALSKDTNLEDLNLSAKYLSAKAWDILSGCIKYTKLRRISIQSLNEDTVPPYTIPTIPVSHFLEGTKNSSVFQIKIDWANSSMDHAERFAQAVMNSTFTHFSLSCVKMNGCFTAFASCLKYTSITHLYLPSSLIGDEDVRLLAENLKETKIMELHLSRNQITCEGVKALALHCPRTSVIHLNLEFNNIENDGLIILAKHFSGSLITTLDVHGNPGNRVLLIDKVVLENRVVSHKIVASFKQVFPESGSFCLHECIQSRDPSAFLENCLQFYRRIVDQPHPAVVSILLQEANLLCSREELVTLLDKFPQQLVEFIGIWVDADVEQHVKFLERAEKLGLAKIVELLLLQRPLYTIDEAGCILHPYVYSLLLKYKQLVCNLDIEPDGIERIIDYCTEHSNLDGAEDVIRLLSGVKIS